jgi:cysteinyl-tRNA synthetase
MTAHYRKELSFSFEALDAASVAYKRLVEFAQHNESTSGNVIEIYFSKALDALSDDLGTPEAVATIWGLLKDDTVQNNDKYATLIAISNLLGLGLENVHKEVLEIPKDVQALIDKRAEARAQKDFTLADALRDEIATHGFSVQDSKGGQEIHKITQ